jgi:ribosomal protein S27E
MKKENGMLKPRDKHEEADARGKFFVCPDCGAERRVVGHRFGSIVECYICPGEMEEKI